MNTSKTFVIAAATLARAAPREWESFIEAFRAHANEYRDFCLSCTGAELTDVRGRAVGVNLLFKSMSEALVEADKLSHRQK